MEKNKKLIVAAGAAFVVIAAMLVVVALWAGKAHGTEGLKRFTVEVEHADGTVKTFTYRSTQEFLGQALLDEKLVEGEESQFGLYITKVDGESAVFETDNAYWGLYVDGEMAMSGADSTPLTDGGVYRLKYEKG